MEGKIEIRVTTSLSQGGITLEKSATVHTNDPGHSTIPLKIKGRVEKVVTLIPSRVIFTGHVGEPLSQVVIITPETDKPFKIVKVSAVNGTDINYEIKEKERFNKKVYVLTVTNTRKEKGRYYDKIYLKTDSKIVKTIPIMILGNLKPAVKQAKSSAAPASK